jgi:hypothetical protein
MTGYQTIDCAAGAAPYPQKYMETNCAPSYTNRGVESDWLRGMWNVLAVSGPYVTLAEIWDWIHDADVTTHLSFPYYYSPYTRLDNRSNYVGGTLESHWDVAKSANGIDW